LKKCQREALEKKLRNKRIRDDFWKVCIYFLKASDNENSNSLIINEKILPLKTDGAP
jgi:hypothetical protein